MIYDLSQYRRYPLTDPSHAGVVDAERMQDSLIRIDADMNAALSVASSTALGRVQLAANINSTVSNAVPTVGMVRDFVNESLRSEIQKLIGGAPEALDTLKELADAIGGNATLIDSLIAQIALKADKSEVQALESRLAQTGDLKMTCGRVAPAGWFKPHGILFNRDQAVELWAFAQANSLVVTEAEWQAGAKGFFSSGDGAKTFRSPDLRGLHMRVSDDGAGVDSGRLFASIQADANKSHTHTGSALSAGGHVHSFWIDANGYHEHWIVGQREGGLAGLTVSPNHQGNPMIWANGYAVGGGTHAHTGGMNTAGAHVHTLSINADGAIETRVKNVAYTILMKL